MVYQKVLNLKCYEKATQKNVVDKAYAKQIEVEVIVSDGSRRSWIETACR